MESQERGWLRLGVEHTWAGWEPEVSLCPSVRWVMAPGSISSWCRAGFGLLLPGYSETGTRAAGRHLSCTIKPNHNFATSAVNVHGPYSAKALQATGVIWQHFKDEREKNSSVKGSVDRPGVWRRKCKLTVTVVIFIGVVLRYYFFYYYYFKSPHNNFLVWLVSVSVKNPAGLLDLWTAGGNFCWDFFFFQCTPGDPPA